MKKHTFGHYLDEKIGDSRARRGRPEMIDKIFSSTVDVFSEEIVNLKLELYKKNKSKHQYNMACLFWFSAGISAGILITIQLMQSL